MRSLAPSMRTVLLGACAIVGSACSEGSKSTTTDPATTVAATDIPASTDAPSTTSDHTGRKQESDCSGATPVFDVGYGDGWGLSEWTFSPCLLPTTTSTEVVSAGPVAGFGELPVTGGDAGVLVLASASVMVLAGVLLRVRAAR